MHKRWRRAGFAGALFLAGCASIPSGPSLMVLPGTGKNFEQFRADEFACRQYASGQVGGATADQAAADSVARSAALGTAVGAVAGAAIGGRSGAGVGAGTGLAVGALAGAGAGDTSAYGLQRRYDHAFAQCMYAKGHKVPVAGRFEAQAGRSPSAYPPPPPPPPPPR
ncbi:MAG: hypothetical protein HYY28_09395 [Betaproteobacteria bacterium]|nr:hypothetical protein [Betaproteobacteria bacterium]MBI2960515.1 hypothetical protein [Betaproteobacteria bacterium]